MAELLTIVRFSLVRVIHIELVIRLGKDEWLPDTWRTVVSIRWTSYSNSRNKLPPVPEIISKAAEELHQFTHPLLVLA